MSANIKVKSYLCSTKNWQFIEHFTDAFTGNSFKRLTSPNDSPSRNLPTSCSVMVINVSLLSNSCTTSSGIKILH